MSQIPEPYKGGESYEIEDEKLFFGRDDAASEIINKILSRRMTVLHAPSGAGKTSLINAKIIPTLEKNGWFVVRVLPQIDPVESIKASVIRYLIPPLEIEIEYVYAVCELLNLDPEQTTIRSILHKFQEMDFIEQSNANIFQAIELESSIDKKFFLKGTKVTPVFMRLLRGTITIKKFSEYYLFYIVNVSEKDFDDIKINQDTTLSTLLDYFCQDQKRPFLKEDYKSFYTSLVRALDIPVPGLTVFFEMLISTFNNIYSKFKITLILDQFEEVFTRFVDVGLSKKKHGQAESNYKYRYELFDELERLYFKSSSYYTSTNRDEEVERHLPIRYLISIRDDYIAKLDVLRHIIGTTTYNYYHLGWLSWDEAVKAIKGPAQLFSYTYDDDTFDNIINDLAEEKIRNEEGQIVSCHIQPTHLQIVCKKIWDVRGKRIFNLSVNPDKNPRSTTIGLSVLNKLNGVVGIIRNFFNDFLKSNFKEKSHLILALEILDRLITPSGTRNIANLQDLIEAPNRNKTLLKKCFDKLLKAKIIRKENRLGGDFVEITHEFLIGPILSFIDEYVSKNPKNLLFSDAVNKLSAHQNNLFRVSLEAVLTKDHLLTLQDFADLIEWNPINSEILLRQAILIGLSESELSFWINIHASSKSKSRNSVSYFEDVFSNATLGLAELRHLKKQKFDFTHLDPPLKEKVFRSMILEFDDSDLDYMRDSFSILFNNHS